MRARYVAPLIFLSIFSLSVQRVHAAGVILYSQSDDSGEMISQQPYAQNTWIGSQSLGDLFLGKDRLTITFSMEDPNASTVYHSPFGGVALGTCFGCTDLQRYYFTDADRALLSSGGFHTFTVQTGTTTYGTADGETPIYATFFGLSQYHNGTHVKSNVDGTIPYFSIEAATLPVLPVVPEAPAGSVTLYEQGDRSGTMANTQASSQNSYIDSVSLGNLNLGQGQLYLTFSMKSPLTSGTLPIGVCLEPAASHGCSTRLQTYYFTNADRALFADGAFHAFAVLTSTTTNAYADGTRPVGIGFFGLYQLQYATKVKSNAAATIPFLKIQTPPPAIPPDPCIATNTCASNVLFLPGIEGSRLYEGTACGKSAEEKLWEPYDGITNTLLGAGDGKVRDLALDQSGHSVCSDIYAKEGDVIDSVGGSNLYKSFIDEMNGLRTDGTIKDWEPVAYDWRLSLDDLLGKGAVHNGKIYYEEATSTPYIEQTLRALAASSKTGKVTIVAHSNGGLVAKALLAKLGDSEAAKLVDRVIMVAVPQTGAPADIGSLLVGYGAGIYQFAVPIISNAAARTFAQNSPMTYHLLPSEDYLESTVGDLAHPMIRFSGTAYAKEESAYGNTIGNRAALDDFLLAKDGGRKQAADSDLTSAKILNPALIDYANAQHAPLDYWTPPAGIKVDQVAGWGVDTVQGIDFYTPPPTDVASALNPVRAYRPTFIEDGDGTVPAPSALMMASSTDVTRYWLNLSQINNIPGAKIKYTHGNIFEVSSLRDFLKSLLTNNAITLSSYIQNIQPTPNVLSEKLTFFLHSPLTLQLTDVLGNVTGLTTSGSVTQDIPGSMYGQFGEVKYVTVPEGSSYQLSMQGQANGTFSLDVQQTSDDVIIASTTIAGVPTTASTTVALNVQSDLSTLSPMTVDENGDGATDATITPKLGATVIFDVIPPELELTFSTSTDALAFVATDDSGAATVTATTSYPILRKNQKTYQGIATTTVTAIDNSGNTTQLMYTEKLPSPKQREIITPVALVDNGATTTIANISAEYKWRLSNRGRSFNLFASSIRTATTTLESHYQPKKGQTIIMSKPQDLDDSDTDDSADVRPNKQTLPGMVVPYIQTKKGSLIVGY